MPSSMSTPVIFDFYIFCSFVESKEFLLLTSLVYIIIFTLLNYNSSYRYTKGALLGVKN